MLMVITKSKHLAPKYTARVIKLALRAPLGKPVPLSPGRNSERRSKTPAAAEKVSLALCVGRFFLIFLSRALGPREPPPHSNLTLARRTQIYSSASRHRLPYACTFLGIAT